MSTYINIGSINNNNSRNLTINGNPTNVSDIVNTFFHDRQPEDIQAEEVKPQPQDNDQELFKYIHPAITDDAERLRVHREVVNLVKNYPMVDICKHLMQMKKDERVYLGIKPALMFEELHRVGMPGENVQGYSYPNFVNYFNVK